MKTRKCPSHTMIGLAIGTLWLAASPAAVQAQDFTYTTNNGAITITGYSGSGGAVTIPGTITTLPVTAIGNGAFCWCDLTSVTLPASLTDIEEAAFCGCGKLTSIAMGSNVARIGNYAFVQCGSLTAVTLPASVISIGVSVFCWCTSLNEITVETGNPAYSSVGGVLFNKNQTTLVACPGGRAGHYSIPDTVTNIDGAFLHCTNLTSVTIPNSLTRIGASAFCQCYSLTSVTIPDSVTSIGELAFGYCENLSHVTIGNGVTKIENGAFRFCPCLSSVTIPNSVDSIGDEAFANGGLHNITIPSSVGRIGSGAF